jgi:hypothetical protein
MGRRKNKHPSFGGRRDHTESDGTGATSDSDVASISGAGFGGS